MARKSVRPNPLLLGIALALFAVSTVSSVLTFAEAPVAGVLSALGAIIWLVLAVLELGKIHANDSSRS
ncbi:hypothetical protein GCM10023190_13750 [Enteractinococcus fodinae]|uniref:Uncharacterized protein n=1 Tax=Enteractinococcus fodinae TaxID=684663 RepID=A0ABU2B193_9MICC|nr:hypothetical protein [Enteractinococcus fodinae]